jgi:hypothetical protein
MQAQLRTRKKIAKKIARTTGQSHHPIGPHRQCRKGVGGWSPKRVRDDSVPSELGSWKASACDGDSGDALRKAYGLPGFFVSSVFADLQVTTDRYEQLLYLGSAICEMM